MFAQLDAQSVDANEERLEREEARARREARQKKIVGTLKKHQHILPVAIDTDVKRPPEVKQKFFG